MPSIQSKPYDDPNDPEKEKMTSIQLQHLKRFMEGKDMWTLYALVNDCWVGRTSDMLANDCGIHPQGIHIIEKDPFVHRIHQLRGYGGSECDVIKCVKNNRYKKGDHYDIIICDIEMAPDNASHHVKNMIINGFIGKGTYLNVTMTRRTGVKKSFKDSLDGFRTMVQYELKKRGLQVGETSGENYGNARMGRAYMHMYWAYIVPLRKRF